MADRIAGGGRRVIFDIETTGFLEDSSHVHCISTMDFDTGNTDHFFHGGSSDHDIHAGVRYINRHDLCVGHGILAFDIPYLERHCNLRITAAPRDTLVLSKMLRPMQSVHSLEYYGELYGRPKPKHEQWDVYDEDMKFRCDEDVAINAMMYEDFIDTELSKWDWIPALLLEQSFVQDQVLQEVEGVDVDIEHCHRTLEAIDKEVDEIDRILRERLPKRVVNLKPVNKPFKKDGTYSKMLEDWYAGN